MNLLVEDTQRARKNRLVIGLGLLTKGYTEQERARERWLLGHKNPRCVRVGELPYLNMAFALPMSERGMLDIEGE